LESPANPGRFILEDSQALVRAAHEDFGGITALFAKMQPQLHRPDDLFAIYKKYDAVYKGVLNLVHYASGGWVSWQSGDLVSWESNLEDHHIFPKDYLQRRIDKMNVDPTVAIDCVVNRTLIPKLQNIKASNKPPSKYLAEIELKNPKLRDALAMHMIPADILDGVYDDLYELFLEDRAKAILAAVDSHVYEPMKAIVEQLRRG
jgi:hypothetical protein